ncbi:MAG: 2-oxo acid dehydrogenase subunit E2 [Bryobacteraceae bacterium]
MPTVDICMFSDQKEGTESFVGVWLKKPGERVNANEPIVEISTDKVSMEIPAPASGILTEIRKGENEPVTPGEVLGRIEAGVEALPSAHEDLSPAVRRLIRENNLNPQSIAGSGRGGRLTYQDVVDYVASQASNPAPSRSRLGKVVPHSAMRRAIASHMLRSVQSAPHVTAVFEADLSRVVAARTGPDEPPSITAYLIAAAVKAIQAVPEVNSRWSEEGLEIFEDCNIGIGTAIEGGGLIVPVIHRAQTLNLVEIAARLRELTQKARAGKPSADEVQNGTFTISNHGVSGSLLAAPIIIPDGQTAILGSGKLQKRPVVIEDSIQIKPMMYVTLTVDHRALDAQQTNAFLAAFVGALENWS